MLREVREIFAYHSRSTTRFADHDVHNVFEKALRDLKQFGFTSLTGKRVLDLGCGQRFSFALQCAAQDAQVTALDINYIKPDPLPQAFYRMVKHNGVKRAAKSTLRRVLWDGAYYRELESASHKPLKSYRSKINFVVADETIGDYALPSGAYDLIVSNAVLEHVADVPKFAAEVARMLAPGGFYYAIIHNFYSLSGGHNMDWAYPDEFPPKDVPPWDHLRENRFPAWTYLNRCKPEDFCAAFQRYLPIVRFDGVGIDQEVGGLEGERFLTPEIAAELKQYPRELLLTRAYCLICHKE